MLDAPLLGTYWDRVRSHNDTIFAAAVDHLIDTGEKFPNVATLHRAYYDERDRETDERQVRALEPDTAYAAARRNAARLAVEGLPSDALLMRGKGVRHLPGAAMHQAVLLTFDQIIAALMVRIEDRGAEMEARPEDRDLARRFGVLTHTLAETQGRRDHFAATGEMLPPAGAHPDDPNPVPPGTLFLCSVCRASEDAPGGYLRVDVTPGSRHFGGSGAGMEHTPVPCPACNRDAYAGYIAKYGRPEGMPAVALAGAR